MGQRWYAILRGRHGPRITGCLSLTKKETTGKEYCYRQFRTEEECHEQLVHLYGPDWHTRTLPLTERQSAPLYPIRQTLEPIRQPRRQAPASPPVDRHASHEAPLNGPGDVPLSPRQREIISEVLRGTSCFITGSAGTGKSFMLSAMIDALRQRHTEDGAIAVTATTGIAATHIKGSTLHSWAGVGLAKYSAESLHKRVKGSDASERWETVKVLVVDEISMLDGQLFAKLEHLARLVRHDDRPFAGIQLVFCGDFLQLPPVPDWDNHARPPFAFEMPCWDSCISKSFVLHDVMRQQDADFINLLQEVRRGYISPQSLATLQAASRRRSLQTNPTILFPTRAQVKAENARQFDALPGITHTYIAYDQSGVNLDTGERYLEDHERRTCFLNTHLLTESEIKLKIGTRVLLLRNLKAYGLVNGEAGCVMSFAHLDEMERELELRKLRRQRQDAIEMAVRDSDLDPQVLDGLLNQDEADNKKPPSRLAGVSMLEMRACESEIARRIFIQDYSTDGVHRQATVCPIVHFARNGVKLFIPQLVTVVENAKGEAHAVRSQLPLALAYASTIHKSQGMTLDSVQVDLGKVFEEGQAYVALSRARSLSSVHILNLEPHRITANQKVLEWYANLEALAA